jgi:MFS family permease
VSQIGDRVSEIALPLVAVLVLHASALEVGVVTAAVWAPHLVSLVVGAWVDGRPAKRPVLVAADLVQALGVSVVPVAYVLDVLSLPLLVVAATVAGFGGVLHQTAYPTFFVGLVRREQFLEANSLLGSTRSVSFVVGPAVGGQLIALLAAPIAMLVDAVSFVVSAMIVATVRVDEPRDVQPRERGLLRHAADGLRFVVRHAYLRSSLACCTTLNFFSMAVGSLVILYASRNLHLPAGVIGLALGVGAVGGVVGAVLAPRVSARLGVGRTVALGALVFACPAAMLPLAHGLADTTGRAAVLAGVELVSGAGIMLFDTNLNSLQAVVTPDAMRSRAAGAFSTINYGARPMGALAGGVAAQIVGVGPTIVGAAVAGSLSWLWLLGSPILATRTLADAEQDGGRADVPSVP